MVIALHYLKATFLINLHLQSNNINWWHTGSIKFLGFQEEDCMIPAYQT